MYIIHLSSFIHLNSIIHDQPFRWSNPHAFLPLEKQEILPTRHDRKWDSKVTESPWVFEPTLGSPFFYRYKTFLNGKFPLLNCLLRRSRSRHMIFVPNSVPSFNQKNLLKIRCETPKQKPFRVSLMFWTTNWKPFLGKLHIPDHRILLGNSAQTVVPNGPRIYW